jgi:membrane-associated phospholipid phosphatase
MVPKISSPLLTGVLSLCLCLLLICGWQSQIDQKSAFEALMPALQDGLPLSVWWALTHLGETPWALGLCIPWFYLQPRLLMAWGLAASIGGLLSISLKEGFNVLRPAAILDLHSFPHLGPWLYYNSFPSGHTITIFATVGILLMRHHLTDSFSSASKQSTSLSQRGPWLSSVKVAMKLSMRLGMEMGLASLAILVGLSRIALGAHWPLDVLAGACVGGIAACLGMWGMVCLSRFFKRCHWRDGNRVRPVDP